MPDLYGENPYDEPNEDFSHPVLAKMWRAKWPTVPEVFAHATLTQDVELPGLKIPAGTRVLCTMVSCLGDVGIRAAGIRTLTHGYVARVPPAWLTDIVEAT